MTVKEVIAKYSITLKQLKELTENPTVKLSDEVSEWGIGFIEGFTYRQRQDTPIVSKKKTATKKSIKRTGTKKTAKKKKKSVWTKSVPMGGDPKWKMKRNRINS